MWMRVIVLTATLAVIDATTDCVSGQVLNGGFQSGDLSNWNSEGTVAVETADGTEFYAVLRETGSGGLSRIYQSFDVPEDPDFIVFRFALHTTPQVGQPATPPDSLTAFLLDPSDNQPIMTAQGDMPSFIKGFYYMDTDGRSHHDDRVTVLGPDAYGVRTVSLDISELDGETPVRLEFGLANAANGRTTIAVIDGISTTCPVGYCCDEEGIVGEPLEDGLACTTDTCNTDGTASHSEISECCGECVSVTANIVIMLDLTGSICSGPGSSIPCLNNFSPSDVELEVDAARSLLNAFSLGSPKPNVAIGSFNGPCTSPPPQQYASACSAITDMARIEPGGGLTQDYADLHSVLDQILTRVRPPPAYTNLAKAIEVARQTLPTPELNDARNYIVIVSDGIPNWPRNSGCSGVCVCNLADDEAYDAARDAEKTTTGFPGADIFAVHYEGHGGQCSGEPAAGRAFLKDFIATDSSDDRYFLEGDIIVNESSLLCAFFGVAKQISCDDGEAGVDCCIDGECQHGSACNPEP